MEDKSTTGKNQGLQYNANESDTIKSTENQSGDSAKLSDYPDGNLEDASSETNNTSENQIDLPQPSGRTMAEATDPSKLSDI